MLPQDQINKPIIMIIVSKTHFNIILLQDFNKRVEEVTFMVLEEAA